MNSRVRTISLFLVKQSSSSWPGRHQYRVQYNTVQYSGILESSTAQYTTVQHSTTLQHTNHWDKLLIFGESRVYSVQWQGLVLNAVLDTLGLVWTHWDPLEHTLGHSLSLASRLCSRHHITEHVLHLGHVGHDVLDQDEWHRIVHTTLPFTP